MKFKHEEIEIEIGRTANAVGCGLPSTFSVKDGLAKAIREQQPSVVEFDGLGRDGQKQVVRFLLDGIPFRLTNWKYDAVRKKFYV